MSESFFPIDVPKILVAALAFIRIGGVMALLPFFGESSVPLRARIILSAALTVPLYPLITGGWGQSIVIADDPLHVLMYVIQELSIGMSLGFVAKLSFECVVAAANVVGLQMGFGTGSLFLHGLDDRETGFSAMAHALFLLIFLALNFHHLYIETLFQTFRIIPLAGAFPSGDLSRYIIDLAALFLSTAVQLSAPIVVATLFATAALGLLGRAVPQINVLVMSFPMNFYVGLLVYFASLPLMPGWVRFQFQGVAGQFQNVLHMLTRG